MEWSEKYIYTYIDSRLQQVLYVGFDDRVGHSMWDFGQFAQSIENSSLLENPWNQTGQGNTPFDQSFYLILDVAVGSRNGWFLDHVGSKPWIDAGNSELEFYNGIYYSVSRPASLSNCTSAQDEWLPTWGKGPDHGMTIKSVKMWQQGKCQSP
jgi:hypothetical protein